MLNFYSPQLFDLIRNYDPHSGLAHQVVNHARRTITKKAARTLAAFMRIIFNNNSRYRYQINYQ